MYPSRASAGTYSLIRPFSRCCTSRHCKSASITTPATINTDSLAEIPLSSASINFTSFSQTTATPERVRGRVQFLFSHYAYDIYGLTLWCRFHPTYSKLVFWLLWGIEINLPV